MTRSGAILVVDDDPVVREAISAFLRERGHHVLTTGSGRRALEMLRLEPVTFVLLELALPDIAGEDVCIAIRKRSRVPIIMVTAKSDERDMLNGLRIGADDYIIKPFSMENLYARMEAVARRSSKDIRALSENCSWRNGDLVIRFDSREVFRRDKKIDLTPSEWKILSTLSKSPRRVFSRDDLLALCFDHAFEGYDRIIDTHIKNLRRKIEGDPKNPVYIRTVYGMGYRFGGLEQ